jgi:hypothetical protein
MPYQQSDLDKLNAEIANPKEEVRHGDKSMRSRSVKELLAAKNDIANSLAKTTGQTPTRQLRIISDRGW